jgi:hypothetical protein
MSGSEFTPSPLETNELVRSKYNTPRTKIYQFSDDKIDQSDLLNDLLCETLAANNGAVSRGSLDGNHLSPVYVKLQVCSLGHEILARLQPLLVLGDGGRGTAFSLLLLFSFYL